MYNQKSSKNVVVLILVMLAGIVLGGFVGELALNASKMAPYLSWLKWLNYGPSPFGIENFELNLGVIFVHLGFTIKFTVCGVIGLICGLIVYRKM